MKKVLVVLILVLSLAAICHAEEDEYIYSASKMSVQKLPEGYILYLEDWQGHILGVYFPADAFTEFRHYLSLVRFNKFSYIEREWD